MNFSTSALVTVLMLASSAFCNSSPDIRFRNFLLPSTPGIAQTNLSNTTLITLSNTQAPTAASILYLNPYSAADRLTVPADTSVILNGINSDVSKTGSISIVLEEHYDYIKSDSYLIDAAKIMSKYNSSMLPNGLYTIEFNQVNYGSQAPKTYISQSSDAFGLKRSDSIATSTSIVATSTSIVLKPTLIHVNGTKDGNGTIHSDASSQVGASILMIASSMLFAL